MTVRFHDASRRLLVPIDSVTQLPGNYRNGDIDALMESITVNGFYGAVIVNSENVILAGNHRYQALLGLGADSIPVLYADGDWTAGRRIAVADNRLSDLARNDPGLLIEFMTDLSASDIGILGTGFTESDMEQLLMSVEPEPIPEMGQGFGVSVNDIYQAVVECEDEDDLDEVIAVLSDRFPERTIRKVIL